MNLWSLFIIFWYGYYFRYFSSPDNFMLWGASRQEIFLIRKNTKFSHPDPIIPGFTFYRKKWNSDLLYTFNLLEFLKPEGSIEKWEYSVVRFINDQIDSILKNGKPLENWKPYGENHSQLVLRHFGRKMKSTWFLQTQALIFVLN